VEDLMKRIANEIKKAAEAFRDWLIHLFGGRTKREFDALEEKLEHTKKLLEWEKSCVHSFKASANPLLLSASDRKSVSKCVEVFKKQVIEDLGEQMSHLITVDLVDNKFVATVYVYDQYKANCLTARKYKESLEIED